MRGRSRESGAPAGSNRLLLIATGVGLAYWITEAILDSMVYYGGSFWEELYPGLGPEVWMRTVVVALIIAQGLYAQWNARRLHRMCEEPAGYQARLEQQVADRTAELATANRELRLDLERGRELEVELHRHQNHLEKMLKQRAGELTDTKRLLEYEVAERKQAEESRREGERQLHEALRVAGVGAWTLDFTNDTFHMSPSLMEMYGLEKECITVDEGFQRVHPEDRERTREAFTGILHGESVSVEYRICKPSGEVLNVVSPGAYVVCDSNGQPSKLIGITQDISDTERLDREMAVAGQIMEAKHVALREKNLALKAILSQLDAEKQELKTHIKTNIDRVVMPTLRLLRRKVDSSTAEYVDLLDASLQDVTSPFAGRLESEYARLSPGEIEVCNMIRNGRSSKEIAEVRGVSVQTISMQRKRIRRKLGIANKGTNLPALLKSLTV